MAIQHRRGAYADFNPAKLLPGELAVVLSGDPASNTGRSLYICFAPGVVKRIVSYEDFENELQNATEELRNAFTADIRSAISSAITATNTANAATKAADAATKAANEAAAAANAYVMGDISGKTVTFEAAAERAGVQSGDTLAVAFGKLAKFCADLRPYAFELPIDNLESEDAESPLAASMGKELADRIGDLASLPTTDKSNLVAAFREQNANTLKNTQTTLSSASANYFGGTSYAFMISGGAFAILLIRLNVLQAISAGNASACLNGLPFSWKYDFAFPIMHADGTGNFLTGAAGTSSIKLTAGQVPFKTGNYYAIVPVPNIFIA